MSLNRTALKNGLEHLMSNKFRLNSGPLDERMRLSEDLRIDSVMIVQLIVYLEVELRLEVPDSMIDPRTFDTVGSLLDFMQELQPMPRTATGMPPGEVRRA
jgi:aryl carrier protein AsbD